MIDPQTPWDDRPGHPHVWRTLGYRRLLLERGRTIMEWDAGEEYAFPADSGSIVHGGLITTLLDTAMGGACWSILPDAETFLTADLHVEFLRSARPGTLRAEGRVVHRTRRIVFCAAEVHDGDGIHLASGRCTQVLRSRR
ncbi:MAG: PaaI family thioesterase [Actinomycetota bacterium]|nr:PaaI family thioesterase [Actinomycetota bacterium]